MDRNLGGTPGKIVGIIGAALSVFALQIVVVGPVLGYALSLAIFLFFALPLTFIIYAGGSSPFFKRINALDVVWVAASAASIGYLIVKADHILTRVEYVSPLSTVEYVMGIIAIAAVLEATRRAIGLPMVLIALFFFAYTSFGHYLPSPFGHSGFPLDWVIDTMYLTS